MTNVDRCEDEPMRADRMNRGSTPSWPNTRRPTGARLVDVSTDSVFDGERGDYVESDQPNPLNEYARSKLRGEEAAAGATDHLVVEPTSSLAAAEVPVSSSGSSASSSCRTADRRVCGCGVFTSALRRPREPPGRTGQRQRTWRDPRRIARCHVEA